MSPAHGVPSIPNPSSSPAPREPSPAILTGIIPTGSSDDSASSEATSSKRVWREVLGLSLIPPLCTAWIAPADPLLMHGHFPWLVLVPLLIGVQHGALAATLSSALLLGVGVLHQVLSGHAELPALGALTGGCLAVGVIAGHFHDRVAGRLARLSLQASDAARRLSRLSRAHTVLKLSHRRLEERLAAGNWSLANALEEARGALADASSLSAGAEVVLEVLSNQALVQSATFLRVAAVDRRGRLTLEPSARIGNPPATELEHRLVQRALSTGRVVALDAEAADGGAEEALLAVAPLVAASGRVLGVVLIHEMPFMAFQAENLKGLAALTALLADALEDRFVEAHPDAQHLTLVPERSLRAVGTALDAVPLPLDALSPQPSPSPQASPDGDPGEEPGQESADFFVGTRTGTHRRRGIAQSA